MEMINCLFVETANILVATAFLIVSVCHVSQVTLTLLQDHANYVLKICSVMIHHCNVNTAIMLLPHVQYVLHQVNVLNAKLATIFIRISAYLILIVLRFRHIILM